jgi:hypothetical protein
LASENGKRGKRGLIVNTEYLVLEISTGLVDGYYFGRGIE